MFVHSTCCCFPGGWLITHTPLSTRFCTVGTCPQMFRCSLVLSRWWWMKKWSPCPGRSAQVLSRLHYSLESVPFYFNCFKLIYVFDVPHSDLEIVGFIEIADISSPPVISRHLVLPIAVNKGLFWFYTLVIIYWWRQTLILNLFISECFCFVS